MSDSSQLQAVILQLATSVPKLRKQGVSLGGAGGSSVGLLLAQLLDQQNSEVVVFVDPYEKARQLSEDLSFFLGPEKVRFFGHYDTVPYDPQSPDKAVIADRLNALTAIKQGNKGVTVTTAMAASQQVIPPEVLAQSVLLIEKGGVAEPSELAQQLVLLGYSRVEQVEDRGEFALRGELLDLFPVQSDLPVRVDFFDIEIESIKSFDPVSQLSQGTLDQLAILPALEVIVSDERKTRALEGIKQYRAGAQPAEYHQIHEGIEQGSFSGIENYLPLFYETPCYLFDYLPADFLPVILEPENFLIRAQQSFDEINHEYEISLNEGLPTLEPDRIFLSHSAFIKRIEANKPLSLAAQTSESEFNLNCGSNQALSSLSVEANSVQTSPVRRVLNQLMAWNQQGAKVLVCTDTISQAQQIKGVLGELEFSVQLAEGWGPQERRDYCFSPPSPNQPSFVLEPKQLSEGFRFLDPKGEPKLVVVTGEEIFGPKRRKQRAKGSKGKNLFSSLEDLKVGDYVVHVEYGIGLYQGLIGINTGQHTEDFLLLSYSGGDKVYVPVDKLNLVGRFTGSEGSAGPKLNKLGDKSWAKTKSKVRSEVDDMADELIALYAKRAAEQGISFRPDAMMSQEFAQAFEYQETEDQTKAIEELTEDMESIQPMDRLICGDVGYGKTEVAMRACMKAAADGYQVGLLVPTTILALQHYETLCERFKEFPVRIGLVSRFQKPKEIKETLKQLAEGSIDILVGTHRLLSKDVSFKNLGLLVIDEEQRFGVRHKERIKTLRAKVDCLALSATPIPRTLHMAMLGIRDISVINTPPMDRRAIRTRLLKFSDFVVEEAIERELRRGGQVFFIHNRVESIYQVASYLGQLMPKVRMAVAHGQMSETELEDVMHGFINKEYDMLLATTIVESGLDIPNANTIIVNNADQFGLSQLYQLRGRVGRSRAQAYAYFLTSRDKLLSEIARKRLSILQELNHLGAGFKIASYDLELRGAGNLLGSSQSGHIQAVGFELYTQMVESAVAKLQKEPTDRIISEDVRLDLGLETSLPESYIDSMNLRLEAYKEISLASSEEELWSLRSGLEDRFGALPETSEQLFVSAQLRLLVSGMGMKRLSLKGADLEMEFNDSFQPDPTKLFALIQESKTPLRPAPEQRLIATVNGDIDEVLLFLKNLKPRLEEMSLEP